MKRRLSALIAVLFLFAAGAAWAAATPSPYADAEAAVRTAYADYRTALFMTNQKDVKASVGAIAAFRDKWGALATAWRKAPPPQYAADPMLAKTLASVAAINDEAGRIAAAGDLAKAHEVLEAIRDEIGALRARNGVTSFSDRMNAYHEQMEKILLDGYDGFSPAGLARLRDDSAVLAYLADTLGHAKAGLPPDPALDAAIGSVIASVKNLRGALLQGDLARIREAVPALKGPYSKAFLRFG
jgi:hypothetical protein